MITYGIKRVFWHARERLMSTVRLRCSWCHIHSALLLIKSSREFSNAGKVVCSCLCSICLLKACKQGCHISMLGSSSQRDESIVTRTIHGLPSLSWLIGAWRSVHDAWLSSNMLIDVLCYKINTKHVSNDSRRWYTYNWSWRPYLWMRRLAAIRGQADDFSYLWRS